MQKETFLLLLWSWAAAGLATFILLLFITAPYGRHSRKDWGHVIPNRLGWVLMEFPSLLLFILAFLLGPRGVQPITWIFFSMYVFHYLNRSVIYPFRTHTSGKMMPLVVAIMAVFFNLVPRAIDHHQWYRATFEDYPPRRKAVIPYLL